MMPAEIGRQIASRAVIVDLDTLLRDLHNLLGKLLDVRSFMIVLVDVSIKQLDLRLWMENNLEQPQRFLPIGENPIGDVIRAGQPVLLPQGYRAKRTWPRLYPRGRTPRCWLGVPLLVNGESIGAIVVQHYGRENAYTEADVRLLADVADHVAYIIQCARLKEEADRKSRRLAVLQRAGEELMKLAEEREELLWHIALKIATADYGLAFSRAMLFFAENGGAVLHGRMGVDQHDGQQARHRQEKHEDDGYAFDDYLQQLQNGGLRPTPLDDTVRQLVLHLPTDQGALQQALREKREMLVPRNKAAQRLPAQFVRHFGKQEYALLPLVVGDKRIGLVAVDTAYTGIPLDMMPLDQLRRWLGQITLVYENLHRRWARDQLIETHHTVLAQVANLTLKETLIQIGMAAQQLTNADCALIYPLLADTTPDEPRYDVENAGYVGVQSGSGLDERRCLASFIRHILQSDEPLTIENIDITPWLDEQCQMTNQFFLREGIRACIAAPIRHPTTKQLSGILYLCFRTLQTFTAQDARRSKWFAQLAGLAIGTNQVEQEVRDDRDVALSQSQARTHELEILRSALETALKPNITREMVAQALLTAAGDLIGREDTKVHLVLREYASSREHGQEPREIRCEYFLQMDGSLCMRRDDDLCVGITGRAFSTGEDQRVPDVASAPWVDLFRPSNATDMFRVSRPTRSELDVLIKLEEREILGLFNAESPAVDAFTEEHRDILRRLAAAAALALDNVRRQENLHNVLIAAKAVIRLTNLQETLQAVLYAAQEVAPGVSALTIWYKEPGSGQIRLGPYFGVRYPDRMHQEPPNEQSSVAIVIQLGKQIWASAGKDDKLVGGRFVDDEEIVSVAGIPLKADNDEIVGAIFFNYREFHEFSSEERVLFPIIAAIAATSVRDALRLEALQKERQRLHAAIEINEAVGTTLDLDDTLRGIMYVLHAQFPHAQAYVLTFNARRRRLEFATASLKSYEFDQAARLRSLSVDHDRSISCRVARKALKTSHLEWENVGDVRRNRDCLGANHNIRSTFCLALVSGSGRLLGVLGLESEQLNAFTEDDVASVRNVARSISIALDRLSQSAELRYKTTVATRLAWAAEIAHDMNNEIAIIRGAAHLLTQEPAPLVQQSVHQIDASAQRLAVYASTPHTTPREPVRLDEWLKDRIEEIVKPRGELVVVVFDLRCGDLGVFVSPILLERVLRHLVRNALEAMQFEGQLIIRSSSKDMVFAEVQVIDSGPGVADNVRPRLFTEQVSTKEEDREDVEGGLGLLFVRSALEEMQGEIYLLPSDAGQGAVFAFTVPVAQAPLSKEKAQ